MLNTFISNKMRVDQPYKTILVKIKVKHYFNNVNIICVVERQQYKRENISCECGKLTQKLEA